ncbi:THAP domain-containing protein 9 [Elysia marginata]|uniref:THAP domain-containing protein 9 n=1 Tax=Elysia marginata TaxID=1093978 RepID=A0AAV4I047_9GAST|nr:THAP domain-containing protein 9 [Elysia marginata]
MNDIFIVFDSLPVKKECSGCSNSELETEALFFMAVGLKRHWKQPFSYFLGKPNGDNQAQLLKRAVSYLPEKGFIVHRVTLVGCFTNQSTAQMLGCSLDPDNTRPYFPHPEDEKEHIYFFFGACHLLKCVRNCIGDLEVVMHNSKENLQTATHAHTATLQICLDFQDITRTSGVAFQTTRGWNNNPNVLQLKRALLSLPQRNGNQASSQANCIDLTVNDAACQTLFEAQLESAAQPKHITSYAKLLASSSVFHDSLFISY